MSIVERKNNHIRVNLEQDVRSGLSNGFERYRLIHNPLPEADFAAYSTETSFLGKTVSAPFLISSMTGGSQFGEKINRCLSEVAERLNIAFAVGSQRVYLSGENPPKIFPVRSVAPHVPVLANIGAVQLNYGFTRSHCLRAVEMLEADALYLHLNPLQELIQPGGNTDFSGLLKKIEALCRDFPVPIAVKEVGWGINAQTVRKLCDAGVSIIDTAGAGGTSWSKVERFVIGTDEAAALTEPFDDWGIPTAECVSEIRSVCPEVTLIASGGIRNGVDAAKAMLLGANLCGMAGALFHVAAKNGSDALCSQLERIIQQYKIARFLSNGIEKDDLWNK